MFTRRLGLQYCSLIHPCPCCHADVQPQRHVEPEQRSVLALCGESRSRDINCRGHLLPCVLGVKLGDTFEGEVGMHVVPT